MSFSKKKIGLYFGSFNPIHLGHLILANYFIQNTNLSKIWFVVSPQNPLKGRLSLLDDDIRFRLVQLAIKDNLSFVASNVEFGLSLPSYTINTLEYLSTRNADKEFSIIMGEDNLNNFDKWKDYQKIIENYQIYVYPRQVISGMDKVKRGDKYLDSNITMVNAPIINISASYVRELLRKGQSVRYFVPDRVYEEIEKKHLYKQ
ncbi:MAG: nicotinate (nicotinamide) nucleotide adenylyltransferase [Bacteroidales bacterium]